MKKFKLASLATALVLSLSVFAGCDGVGNKVDNDKAWNSLNSGEIIQLVFAGRDVDTEKANYQAFVDEFNKTHENIVIELKWWSDGTAYNAALDGMGKNLPDVFMLNDIMFSSYAYSGKLANIRDHIDESVMDDMYESACNEYYFDHSAGGADFDQHGSYGISGEYTCQNRRAKGRDYQASYECRLCKAGDGSGAGDP